MIPHWWNEKVTIFHKKKLNRNGLSYISWSKEVASHCFLRLEPVASYNGSELTKSKRLVIRIPSSECSSLDVGDVILKGTSSATTPPSDGMIVSTVNDNRKLSSPHWYGSVDNEY